MTLQDAVAYIDQRIAFPAFFDRLAQYGIVPQTPADAWRLLKRGVALYNAVCRVPAAYYKLRATYLSKTASASELRIDRWLQEAASRVLYYLRKGV